MVVLSQRGQVRLTLMRVGLLHDLRDALVQLTPLARQELGQDCLTGERVPKRQPLGRDVYDQSRSDQLLDACSARTRRRPGCP